MASGRSCRVFDPFAPAGVAASAARGRPAGAPDGERERASVRGPLRAPSSGALPVLPDDRPPRRGCAGRPADDHDPCACGARSWCAGRAGTAVAVPHRAQRGGLGPAAEAPDSRPRAARGLEARLEERSRLTALVADLNELPERQRGALVMRELSGLSHEEIAAALDVSVSAVKQAIFDARSALHSVRHGQRVDQDRVHVGSPRVVRHPQRR